MLYFVCLFFIPQKNLQPFVIIDNLEKMFLNLYL